MIGHTSTSQNLHVYTSHHHTAGILPQNTYFLFQGKYYKQVHGVAMDSPTSAIVASLFMENLETKAIITAFNPPILWLRCVDDIFVIQKAEHSNWFLQHINFIDPHIQFTTETPKSDRFIPFLDTFVSPGPDNSLLTTVYRKLSHTEQCHHWDSYHNLYTKYSVFGTLTHRTRTVYANLQLLHKQEEHIKGPYK